MARKPRTALASWIKDNRRRLGQERHPDHSPLKVEEVAAAIGVDPVTVRGWEAGRGIKDDNLAALERFFDREAPDRGGSASPDQLGELAAAMMAQANAISALANEIRRERATTRAWLRGWRAVLRAAAAGQVPVELLDALVPPSTGDVS